MRTIYSQQTDDIIREIYPKHGSKACVEAIFDRLGLEYRQEQIADRARKRLKLTRDGNFQKVLPQNQAALAYWADYPEGFVGPCPHKVGSNLIIAYLGMYRRGKSGRISHLYRTMCTNCGTIDKRLQVSLAEAKNNNVQGCVHCAPLRRKLSIREERERKIQWEADQRQAHIGLMAAMPLSSTPLTLSPEFDFYQCR